MDSKIGFELHGLQKLFVTTLTSVKEPECFVAPEIIHEFVIGEVARVKHRIIENALAIEGEDAVRRYVRIHQCSIVALMDSLFRRRDQREVMEYCELVDGLLTFLQQQFPQYFDDRGRAPLLHIDEMHTVVGLTFNDVYEKLSATGIDDEFANIILDPLYRFYLDYGVQRISFHRLRFLEHVYEHCTEIAQDKHQADYVEQGFLELLMYLNYNSRQTYMGLVQYIRGSLPSELDSKSKRAAMSRYLKTATQATVHPESAYHPDGPTLKSQFIHFLTTEMANVDQEDCDKAAGRSGDEIQIPTKPKFDLSVAQLGCLLRLLADTGVVSCENISALIRWVALNCETKKSQNISPESLRIKFYDIEEGTRRAVQERLIKLLKSVENLPG